MTDEVLDAALRRYEAAEAAYLEALGQGRDDRSLGAFAVAVARAASEWEEADLASDAPADGITRYYDPPEILRTLWTDVATAYTRRDQTNSGTRGLDRA